MNRLRLVTAALPLIPLLMATPSPSGADDGGVYWHIDPTVRTCSMVIDPSLTQAQWRTFTREVGVIANFRSLAPAEPLGRLRFTIGVDYSVTPVDQHDPAWINTFTHPSAACPLGDQIQMPTLRVRVGVSSTTDVGAYWTARANYGLLGGEIKHAFLKESARVPAAAVTASFVTLTGVPDYNLGIYSVGVAASKRVAMFTPYLGVKEGVATGTETTSKVALKRESIPFTQGVVGVAYSVWKLGFAAEYDVAVVNTFALVIGVHP